MQTVGCVIVCFLKHPVYIAKPLIESLRFSQFFIQNSFGPSFFLCCCLASFDFTSWKTPPGGSETAHKRPTKYPSTTLGGCLRMWYGKMRMRSLKSWVGREPGWVLHEIWRSIYAWERLFFFSTGFFFLALKMDVSIQVDYGSCHCFGFSIFVVFVYIDLAHRKHYGKHLESQIEREHGTPNFSE